MRSLIVLLMASAMALSCATRPVPTDAQAALVAAQDDQGWMVGFSPDPLVAEAIKTVTDRAPKCDPYLRTLRVGFGDLSELNYWGYTCEVSPGHWVIMLHYDMDPYHQRDVFLHEYAHFLTGHAGPCNEDDHGPIFGVNWAAAYRAYHGFGEFAPVTESGQDSADEPNSVTEDE